MRLRAALKVSEKGAPLPAGHLPAPLVGLGRYDFVPSDVLTALIPLCGPLQSHRRVYPNQANNTIPSPITSTSSIRQLSIPSSGAAVAPSPSKMSPEAAVLFTISSHHTSPLDCNLITHLARCLRPRKQPNQKPRESCTVGSTATVPISASQAWPRPISGRERHLHPGVFVGAAHPPCHLCQYVLLRLSLLLLRQV